MKTVFLMIWLAWPLPDGTHYMRFLDGGSYSSYANCLTVAEKVLDQWTKDAPNGTAARMRCVSGGIGL